MSVNDVYCPKCKGVVKEDRGLQKCSKCGADYTDREVKLQYLLDHRDDILEDYKRLPLAELLKKWQISSNRFYGLLARWDIPLKGSVRRGGRPAVKKAGPAASVDSPVTIDEVARRLDRRRDGLPPWRDEWDPAVQLEWLHVFNKILTAKTKED